MDLADCIIVSFLIFLEIFNGFRIRKFKQRIGWLVRFMNFHLDRLAD